MKTIAILAPLLEYPGPDLDNALAAAEASAPDFVAQMLELSVEDREELFSNTFDINPACVPYAGIHLFGEENFKRGELMAGLFARYEETEFVPNGDLPDHIANLLRFAVEADPAERRELAEFCLLGPLQKMSASLDEANPYHALLKSVRAALESALPDVRPALSPLEQMRNAPCSSVAAGCSSCSPLAEPV